MRFCKNCGNQLADDAKFCTFCGTAQATEEAQAATTAATTQAETVNIDFATTEDTNAPSGKLNIGMLIWSIVNLLCCCTPLGIAGLIFSIIAKDASTAEEEAKKVKGAKICNLIGSIGGAVVTVLYVVFIVIMAMAEM